MSELHLYERIAESIRMQILEGKLKPGERLASVREMAELWECTPGTIQRAYKELARDGLVISHAGQGTKVADEIESASQGDIPLRHATLVHRAEAYFLEMLTAGYELPEIETAMQQAMDRWRTLRQQPKPRQEEGTLLFCGSHDILVTWIASHFSEISPGSHLQLQFVGSLGGLIALAEERADLAGSHLWDKESDSFNAPFIRRILPGRKVAMVTVADRRLGFILPHGNPAGIEELGDLAQKGVRFINRQRGSGTRVWLDIALAEAGITPGEIQGYDHEKTTHSAVAREIAEGEADAGVGLEAAARSYGLDFVFLWNDRYDLIIPESKLEIPSLTGMVKWLKESSTKEMIESLGGYDIERTGQITWVD